MAELKRHGPVIAIGRPGEHLPPLGAARQYLREDWHDDVSNLISKSQIIVLLLGASPGVHWEIGELANSGALSRTIIVLPPVNLPELQRRWSLLLDKLRESDLLTEETPITEKAVLATWSGTRGLQIIESWWIKRTKKDVGYTGSIYRKKLKELIASQQYVKNY